MTDWQVLVPPRLYEEFAALSPGGRRVVHDVLDQLATEPRDPRSSTEPIHGAELRRIMTAPAPDTGDRITVLYRVTDPENAAETGTVSVLFILAGP